MENLTGKKFNRLTVLELGERKYNKNHWKCKCECGNIKDIESYALRKGIIKSCGCLLQERYKNAISYVTTHGDAGTRLYSIYKHMKRRCYEKTNISYKNYGKRGIRVCKEWKDNYETFRDWALKNGYSDDLSIDRIDGNKNYSPDNCKWSTRKEQSSNRRGCHSVEVDGITYPTLVSFCEKFDLKYDTVKHRYRRGDRTFERLSRPPFPLSKREKKTPR
jgi:hypothetical protein